MSWIMKDEIKRNWSHTPTGTMIVPRPTIRVKKWVTGIPQTFPKIAGRLLPLISL